MLIYCGFDSDLCPLLVDAIDVDKAAEMAMQVAGERPARFVPIPPGVFVAQLFVEDADGSLTIVDALDHVADHLERIDDALEGGGGSELELVAACGQQADASGELVACTRSPSHDGQHEGVTSSGAVVVW